MQRSQFLRRLKKLCKARNFTYDWKPGEGKGSHGIVYVNGRKSTVQDADLPRLYIETILKQLGLEKSDVN